jgi:hypothetical protein
MKIGDMIFCITLENGTVITSPDQFPEEYEEEWLR